MKLWERIVMTDQQVIVERCDIRSPAARVAVELSVDAARQLMKTIEAVLAEADQRGVLEDVPVVAVPATVPPA